MIPRHFGALALALMLPACTLLSPPPTADAMPRFVPSPAQSTPGPVIALVLSGGSARGFAHVGVIKVLEANGLRPSIIVGSSAGSLVGALYASGLTSSELEDAARSLELGFLGDWIVPGTGFFREELGLVRANNLQRFVERWSRHARIEHYPIRFAAVATDLQSGAVAVFNAGDAGLAVLASCAIPGLIAPVRIAGRWVADGQTSSPLPVQAARRLGADRIIAVDVLYPPEDAELTSLVSVLFQSNLVSVHRLKDLEAAGADLVLTPKIPRTTGQYAFEDRDMLMAAGESAARAAIERIRDVFGRGSARGETAAR